MEQVKTNKLSNKNQRLRLSRCFFFYSQALASFTEITVSLLTKLLFSHKIVRGLSEIKIVWHLKNGKARTCMGEGESTTG